MSGDDHGHTGEARMIGRPWTEADGVEEPPAWPVGLGTCRHCGRLGSDPDGDHSCPCPHSDATCPDHPAEAPFVSAPQPDAGDCDNTTHVCSCGQPFDLVHDADCNIWLNCPQPEPADPFLLGYAAGWADATKERTHD